MQEDLNNKKLLVVDDDRALLEEIKKNLESRGFSVTTAQDGIEGLSLCLKENFDLVITDMRMPKMGGKEMIRKILMKTPDMPVIVITAYGNIQEAVRTIKEGVNDYVLKPLNWDDLYTRVVKALKQSEVSRAKSKFKEKVNLRRKSDYIIANSKIMQEIFSIISFSGKRDEPVIILGEDGTEKDRVARAIHYSGIRQQHPFVEINCHVLSDRAFWTELVGKKSGSGHLFQEASGGTLHFEDIHNLNYTMKETLHKIMRNYYPYTEDKNLRFILSLTPQEYKEDEFQGIIIKIPPLRERLEDIPVLAYYYLEEAITEIKKRIEGFSDEAMKCLMNYTWPENTRELRQKVWDAVVMCNKPLITSEDLLIDSRMSLAKPISFKEAKKRFEKDYVTLLLRYSKGNVSRAATISKKDRKDFYYLMRKYNINPKDFR
jgi:two-component system response regulator GlrR